MEDVQVDDTRCSVFDSANLADLHSSASCALSPWVRVEKCHVERSRGIYSYRATTSPTQVDFSATIEMTHRLNLPQCVEMHATTPLDKRVPDCVLFPERVDTGNQINAGSHSIQTRRFAGNASADVGDRHVIYDVLLYVCVP